MGFLDKKMMAKRVAAANVVQHPLLDGREIPASIKVLYLQGCVIAVLESAADGKLTDLGRSKLNELGLSLQIKEEEINEAITVVEALNTEDQGAFLDELIATLSHVPYSGFFISDFERLIRIGGELTEDQKATVEYFRKELKALTNPTVSENRKSEPEGEAPSLVEDNEAPKEKGLGLPSKYQRTLQLLYYIRRRHKEGKLQIQFLEIDTCIRETGLSVAEVSSVCGKFWGYLHQVAVKAPNMFFDECDLASDFMSLLLAVKLKSVPGKYYGSAYEKEVQSVANKLQGGWIANGTTPTTEGCRWISRPDQARELSKFENAYIRLALALLKTEVPKWNQKELLGSMYQYGQSMDRIQKEYFERCNV